MLTGSGVQLARVVADWIIMRQRIAIAGLWSRFETKIAACAIWLAPSLRYRRTLARTKPNEH